MVVLKRIHIKNFRSIVDATIELDDFNFFVGKNDSGKSNVLKAINLFFNERKYSLQGTTQSRYLTGGVPPVRFSM